jgi:uncharacterized protein YbjT (DUF2867 family)
MPKTALVLRATGTQGRAVTEHLRNAGWTVHALVKDLHEDRTLAIQRLGAELFQGTLGDATAIATAIEGCNALFLNQMPSLTSDAEFRDASAILDAAKEAGIQHVVYNTMLRLDDPDLQATMNLPWARMLSAGVLPKSKIEPLVQSSGIPWTIIRPGYFMTNLTAPLVHWMFPELASGEFVSSYTPDTILPLIDPYDIGSFVAAAFQNPRRFEGKIIKLAGQKLSIEETVDEIRAASRAAIKIRYRTAEENEAEINENPRIAAQYFTVGMDKFVDLQEVKQWGIPLTTLRDFLEKNKDTIIPDSTGAPAEGFELKLD